MQKLPSSSVASTMGIKNALTLLLLFIVFLSSVNTAPILLHGHADLNVLKVFILHHDSGRYITVDPDTGKVTATSSVRGDTTQFRPSASSRYESVIPALNDHFLSIIKEENSTYYAVHNSEISDQISSGISSGLETASGSGSIDLEMEPTKLVFSKWQEQILNSVTSVLKIEGQECYLAFEDTGEPVSDPCNISPLDSRAAISIR